MVAILKKLTLTLAIGFSLSGSLAWGEDSCRIFDDKGDRFSFGRVLLGSDSRKLFLPNLPSDCFEYECYYRDASGIEYTAVDNEIVNKELYDQYLVSYRLPLIAGISWNDTVDEVRQKIRALPADFPAWKLSRSSGGDDLYFLATGPCLRASNGTIWGYLLIFDKDAHLTTISTFVLNYEKPT